MATPQVKTVRKTAPAARSNPAAKTAGKPKAAPAALKLVSTKAASKERTATSAPNRLRKKATVRSDLSRCDAKFSCKLQRIYHRNSYCVDFGGFAVAGQTLGRVWPQLRHRPHQLGQPDEVVRRGGEGEHPTHRGQHPVTGLAKAGC